MAGESEEDEGNRVESCQDEAKALLQVLRRQARRPFVLEVTGTPKAGKTTLIGMVDSFLRDCGWRVHVLRERAGECPLPMKGHFFFNTWTMGTMLAGLSDAVDRDYDFVVLDRGIFDALIWLEMQSKNGQVSAAERTVFEAFVTLERWRQFTDAVCLLETDPNIAMHRENLNRLSPRSGTIMNPAFLGLFNQTLASLRQRWSAEFSFIEVGNGEGPRAGGIELIEKTLVAARAWADPEIAVLSRQNAENLLPASAVRWTDTLWDELRGRVEYRRRSLVEESEEWVQLLACGVETNKGQIFHIVRRPRSADTIPRRRDNTAMLWRGCHILKPQANDIDMAYVQSEVLRRLRADLHLGELDATPEPRGIIWEAETDERHHMGLIFRVAVTDELAKSLDEKQFKTNGRGPWMKRRFVSPSELSADALAESHYMLESWSKLMLAQRWFS